MRVIAHDKHKCIATLLLAAFLTHWPRLTLALTPFVIETVDGMTTIVGLYSSLELDSEGNPHVSYFDDTFLDLKYARKSGGVWTIETVDGSTDNVVGLYSSLALDAQGNPHVCYLDATAVNIKYARKSGGVWTTEVVIANGRHCSIALDTQGNPHVSYHDDTIDDLKYARKSGGVWMIETADGSANDVGAYSSLALDASGNPHVSYLSYYDALTADLKYAWKSGGVWTTETADGSENFAGTYSSLALDAQGNPHVSYFDFTTADLKYARKSGGVWMIETADGSANDVGRYTSLALDAQGNPHVTYRDFEMGDLKFADAAVHLLNPAPGVTWPVGSRQEIAWSGVGTVDLYLTSDGSNYEEILADNIISSPISIRVPHVPSRFARLILVRSSPFSTSTTDSFFTINATIALLKFDANTVEAESKRAVRLSWETAPGPEADVRYRIERAASKASGGAPASGFEPIHPGLLERNEYLDAKVDVLSRYRLVAVNGLGEEYVLGETASAPALGDGRSIVASPNVARDGEIQVAFRVASDLLGTDVAVFDASGRVVRGLASGVFPAGIRTVTWDGRDDRGERASAGVYFVRLAWGGQPRESARVTFVR